MSHWKSEEEARQQYMEAMGPDLGELFHALSNELTWIHWRWKQYRVLFGEKPTRLDLLNGAAPLFFRLVQDVFFEDALLGIARLVGPVKSLGKPNLSIARLPSLRNVLNHVEQALCRATTSYAHSPLIGDANELLYVIRDGLRRKRDRSACWDKGELHEDDLCPQEEP